MKFPSKPLHLPNGLVFETRTITPQNWQYHVLKHPLGFGREAAIDPRKTPDPEGWATTKPPVVEEGWKQAALQQIAQLQIGEGVCALPEVKGKRADRDSRYACWDCPRLLAQACVEATSNPHPIGPRYAAVAEELLRSLVDGQSVPTTWLPQCVMRNARRPEILHELCVLMVGQARNGTRHQVARAVRGDGVVVEFKGDGSAWVWKTTYRIPTLGMAGAANLFLRPPPNLNSSLSGNYIVARQWWERYGN